MSSIKRRKDSPTTKSRTKWMVESRNEDLIWWGWEMLEIMRRIYSLPYNTIRPPLLGFVLLYFNLLSGSFSGKCFLFQMRKKKLPCFHMNITHVTNLPKKTSTPNCWRVLQRKSSRVGKKNEVVSKAYTFWFWQDSRHSRHLSKYVFPFIISILPFPFLLLKNRRLDKRTKKNYQGEQFFNHRLLFKSGKKSTINYFGQ